MRNNKLLESTINITFDELIRKTPDEFRSWVVDMRSTILDLWDNHGLPPRVGYDEDEIIHQFKKMEGFPVHEFLVENELTGKKECIRNTSIIGNAANEWFPTMMATKINYGTNGEGRSIYDFFAKPELLETFQTYAARNFGKDSFYHYSLCVKANDHENLNAPDGKTWVEKFEKTKRIYGTHDYWLNSKKSDGGGYTGYNEELRNSEFLYLTDQDVEDLGSLIPESSKSKLELGSGCNHLIRFYEFGQKVFPLGLKAFRVSFCQYAVQYPPLTAKLLYEKYTEKLKNQDIIKIYDPSMGWGGRLLAAMAVKSDRKIHYIGTDPNTDHNTDDGRTKYHQVADFYNKNSGRNNPFFESEPNTYEIYQLGSEEIGKNLEFQKHRGDLDLVFTSPPYFAKEVYSNDPEQSCHKFPQYEAWRDGFLRPTLETAVEWLKPNRYLLWNISDAKFGQTMLPLEQDSIDILVSLGMKHIETYMMTLSPMPGANRIVEGKPMFKNYCKIDGKFFKYEPIFVFLKT